MKILVLFIISLWTASSFALNCEVVKAELDPSLDDRDFLYADCETEVSKIQFCVFKRLLDHKNFELKFYPLRFGFPENAHFHMTKVDTVRDISFAGNREKYRETEEKLFIRSLIAPKRETFGFKDEISLNKKTGKTKIKKFRTRFSGLRPFYFWGLALEDKLDCSLKG